MHFLYLHCSGSACWLYWGLLFICSSNFLATVQLFAFSNNFSPFFYFTEIGDKYSSIFDAVTQISWVCHRLNAFQLLRMAYYNQRSRIVLVNNAKYRSSLQVCNFIKKRLQHRCFPVIFVKFLRAPFSQNTSGGCFWKYIHVLPIFSTSSSPFLLQVYMIYKFIQILVNSLEM